MKTKFYTVCRQGKAQEWANPNNVLGNYTSKTQAKREAKEWAASLRKTVSVWRITKEDNGRGFVVTFPEWIGQAESPVYLSNMEQTPADICGNWAE